jgi:SlyX protein
MEERLNELEMRFTEQQALLQELSDVIYAQSRQLEGLQASLALVQKKLVAEPGMVDANEKELPPHY